MNFMQKSLKEFQGEKRCNRTGSQTKSESMTDKALGTDFDQMAMPLEEKILHWDKAKEGREEVRETKKVGLNCGKGESSR